MILTYKRVVFLVLLIGLSLTNYGQNLDLNFLNISSKDGLSSNMVNAILKDSYGYLWFGTDDGLNKFDGQSFVIYRHKLGDYTSIPSNEILNLHEDSSGNLWIGTAAGVVFYNRKQDSFISYKSTQYEVITAVCSNADGNILVATYGGLFILNPKTDKLSELPVKSSSDQKVVHGAVLKLTRDSKNRIWFGTGSGLYLYRPKEKALKLYQHSDGDSKSLAGNYINAISEDLSGNIWIGTNSGLSKLNNNAGNFTNYYHNPSDKGTLSSSIVYAIAITPEGKLWVGTEDGLNILSPLTGDIYRVVKSSRNKYSLVGKSVKHILVDKQGVIWVATFRGGVNKYDKNLTFFNLRQSNQFDPFGLSAPVVTSFAKSPDQASVYVGTDGGGLNLFNLNSGAFKHIILGNSTNDQRLSILTMERDQAELWIGTYLQGIYVLNTSTGQIRHLLAGTTSKSLSSNDIFTIKRDSRGNIWVGTNGQGVDFYDKEKQKFTNFSFNRSGNQHLPVNGFIRSIEEDKDGNIWIGTNGSGIAVYNPVTGKFKLINKATTKLPIDNIYSIHAAHDGKVWIGTAGGGITSYDPETEEMTSFSEDEGLSNGVVYKLIEDGYGKIWLSTNKGISSFDTFHKRFKNYSYYNGVQKSPFVLGSGIKLNNGTIFFGGTDGFNYFNPDNLHYNKSIPKVVFTDLKINNQSVQPLEDSPIQEHISVAKKIDLEFKQNFSISFVALNYTSPQENNYSYKLENFDSDWNRVGQNKTAVYTNLDPGEYTFKVRANSDSGDWQTAITSIKIFVHPPFWRTYYAYALYLIIALAILFFIRRQGINKLKTSFALEQERIQVKQLIDQERREAERIHEFDQMKIKFLTNLSHEFRTPISLIMGPVEHLMLEETSSKKHQQLQMVKRNARRLLNLVNQLLDFRNIRAQETKLHTSEGDFIAFAREVADSFRDLADRKNINFVFQSALATYFTAFDQDKVERIFFNLLSNAFKFTLEGGEVTFRIEESVGENGLKIYIIDSGIGIDHAEKDKVFDRFFQIKSNPSVLNQGSGMGLSIAKEFVKLHSGTIEVESIAGEGSTFIVYFPFEKIEGLILRDLEKDDSSDNDNDLMEDEQRTIKHKKDAVLPSILLVEDNEDFRFYLKDNLKSYFKVLEASNGKEGWQKVLSSHPQVVVSDISMPYVSGTELCRKIKSDKRTKHIPVILLTAVSGEENQLLGLETGASDYMTKPFNFEILHVKIRNLLTLNEELKSTYSRQMKVQSAEVEIESENAKFLYKVLQYIEENLTNPQLTVEELSKSVGMSRGSLYTKILEITGETPVEFIRSVKLEKAAVLLEKSDLNISQICYSVGFATPNYFARAFKSKYNMLPSEYLNKKRNETA